MPDAIDLRALYKSFSLRRNRQKGSTDLPPLTSRFRARVVLYFRDFVEHFPEQPLLYWGKGIFWFDVTQRLQHLYGTGDLSSGQQSVTPVDEILTFLNTCSTEEFFDFLEQAFLVGRNSSTFQDAGTIVPAINEMFRIEDLPFELTNLTFRQVPVPSRPHQTYSEPNRYPQVIVVAEQVIHQEAIEPALAILEASHLQSADGEFRKALTHYRKSEFADSLTACGSAMESTLKVLCQRNGWSYNQKDTLSTLLDVVVDESSLDNFFSQPFMLIGTIRNRLSSAHGKGTQTTAVLGHIAQYAITSTAAAIVLLVSEADPQ